MTIESVMLIMRCFLGLLVTSVETMWTFLAETAIPNVSSDGNGGDVCLHDELKQ